MSMYSSSIVLWRGHTTTGGLEVQSHGKEMKGLKWEKMSRSPLIFQHVLPVSRSAGCGCVFAALKQSLTGMGLLGLCPQGDSGEPGTL